MSDDDWDAGSGDDWDDEAIERKLKEQEKLKELERRRAEGLESESEEEQAPTTAAAPKPKPKPKAKAEPRPEDYLKGDELKIYLREQQEKQQMMIGNDMFAGCAAPDTDAEKKAEADQKEAEVKAKKDAKPEVVINDLFDKVELKLQGDVEKLCATCVTKVEKSKAKGVSVKFCTDLMKELGGEMDVKDLEAMEKMLAQYVKEKKVVKGEKQEQQSKAKVVHKNSKFDVSGEWSTIYGGGGQDEEWTQEEWDEWEKKEAVAYTAWEQKEAQDKKKRTDEKVREQIEWEKAQQADLHAKLEAEAATAQAAGSSDPLPGEAKAKAKGKARK